MQHLVWNGTPEEMKELRYAVDRHCDGEEDGQRCPAHSLLVESQWQLDGLLFARRIRERLLFEEFRDAGVV